MENGVITKVDGVCSCRQREADEPSWYWHLKECHHVGTVVHMAVDGKYAGHILILDIIKPLPQRQLRT